MIQANAIDQQLYLPWQSAVNDYIKEMSLTTETKKALQQRSAGSEDIVERTRELFSLSTIGWDENKAKEKSKYHAAIQQTVLDTLALFDLADSALGLAAATVSSPHNLPTTFDSKTDPFCSFFRLSL
jgi:hypothetical protein